MNGLMQINNAVQGTQSPTLAELYSSFEDYISVKKITWRNYEVAMRCFFQWLSDNGITRPERRDIKNYIAWLSEPHESRKQPPKGQKPLIITYSAGTQATYLRPVKMFFEWADSEGLYPNISRNLRGAKVDKGKHKRDAFTKDDYSVILQSIDRSTDAGKRDYVMISLCLYCGLRTIELQRADVGNLETLAGQNVLYIQHKGHDEADDFHKLPPELYEAIQEYLHTRGKTSAADPLFCGTGNRNRGRLEEPTISKIIKQRLIAAGYNSRRLTAHSMRHAAITNLILSGASIREAQVFAGHKSPDTTCIYIHDQDRINQNFEQRLYDYINDKERPAEKWVERAERIEKKLTDEEQRAFANELEALVLKYENMKGSDKI